MTDILAQISTWSVLKWVILVLIAGFIGQFGRMLAEAIAARVRRQRAKDQKLPVVQENLPSEAAQTPMPSRQPDFIKNSDKKALKAQAKARKKEAKNK